ncbi:MAG: rhamnulokinase [Bacteroidales bacterium]
MRDNRLFVAVDLGAGSGRVFLAGFLPGELVLEEVKRFHYPPRRHEGHLRWDARAIFDGITSGLGLAAVRARELGRLVHSVGVDAWGVDYGLVNADGRLLEDPICYRDERTDGIMEQVFARMPREEIFARTGIQFLPLNTIFQLYAHVRGGLPRGASRLLLVPHLVNAFLCGRFAAEFTHATTTQLINAAAGDWDGEIVRRLGLPGELLCPIVLAGEPLSPLAREVAAATTLRGVNVVAPATHDTASAVVGAPIQPGWAFISSGTWSLVGVERPATLINRDVAHHNFTNEGGVRGTTRFLKNVCGLWLLESCRKQWQAQGQAFDYDALLGGAAALHDSPALIWPDDPRFLNPPNMLEAIAAQLALTGQQMPTEPAAVTRLILDSLALRYASVVRTIECLTGTRVEGVQIVGGGSQNAYLNQATATATGKPVLSGPVEATVIGNAVVQAMTAGRFSGVDEARRYVATHVQATPFVPRRTPAWERAERKYASIEGATS